MNVLVHAGEADQCRAAVSDRTDYVRQLRVPRIDFAGNDRRHREACRGMTRRERHEWSITIVKTAKELKVIGVIHVHVRQRSAENALPEPGETRRQENRLCYMDPRVRDSRYS